MTRIEWSGSMSCCKEILRNVNFHATIWLKMQHFCIWQDSDGDRPLHYHLSSITEGHPLPHCCALVQYPLPSAARISKNAQSEVLLQFHARAQAPTSQHIIRMHSSPSLIVNLKQLRRFLRSRDRQMEFRLRFAHFGPFDHLTAQHRLLRD